MVVPVAPHAPLSPRISAIAPFTTPGNGCGRPILLQEGVARGYKIAGWRAAKIETIVFGIAALRRSKGGRQTIRNFGKCDRLARSVDNLRQSQCRQRFLTRFRPYWSKHAVPAAQPNPASRIGMVICPAKISALSLL